MPSYVITGAARGLGFEFVRQLSSSPENVVFALVRNKKTATKLGQLNRSNIHLLEADIVDYKALKAAAQEASKITGGKLDVLINNAALIYMGEYLTLDGYPEGKEENLQNDLRQSFETNVIGVVHTINAFLPLLRAGSLKKVITISTGVADLEFVLKSELALGAPYAISKAAVTMAVAKYAVQFKSEGFLFLAISPGFVNTLEQQPSPEQLEGINVLVTQFRKVDPSFEGPISPETSVRQQLEVIDKFTVEDTGAFVSHHGNKEWL